MTIFRSQLTFLYLRQLAQCQEQTLARGISMDIIQNPGNRQVAREKKLKRHNVFHDMLENVGIGK